MNKKKNILFIVPRFGSIQRGVENFAHELASRLDKNDYAITILSGPHESEIHKVNFEHGPLLKREILCWLEPIFSYLPDLFRLFGFGGTADVESFSLLRKYKDFWPKDAFDIIVPLGGSWSYKFSRKCFPGAYIISIGQAGPVHNDLRYADYYVSLTKYDRLMALKMEPALPSVTIPNGVDLKRFDVSHTKHINSEKKVILCIAALVEDKRHDLLFDAVLLLPSAVSILCIGAGPHYAVLKKHPLVLQGRVKFETCSFSEVPAKIKMADIFSLPSPTEAFGIVFIEAMASGLQVVAHAGARQIEILGDVGIFCDVYKSVEYAAAIDLALSNPIPPREIRERALEFDWDVIVMKYERLFSLCTQ